MKMINKYANLVPYLYFIGTSIYWFTLANSNGNILTYLILLLIVPFIWQLIKPNKELNFTLGISFVCLSSYAILINLFGAMNLSSLDYAKGFIMFSGIFAISNFFMSLWIIRNSLRQAF